jgi:predicted amidophosphoribosyltransferase
VGRGGGGDGTACTVCLENPREVVLTGCGHVCLCSDCADRIREGDNRCPVCRRDIDQIQPAYIS